MVSNIAFRRAGPDDAALAIPLIYSAGPQAIDYGFAFSTENSFAFLSAAFIDGRGFFGWRNHTVALADGMLAGIGATYDRSTYGRLALEHAMQVWHHYGVFDFAVAMRRALQLQSLMPPPGPAMHYLANFGVREDLRGRGIGRALLEQQKALAPAPGCRVFALDVSVENPRALALYERCGLRVLWRNRFPGPVGAVPDTLRMELRL